MQEVKSESSAKAGAVLETTESLLDLVFKQVDVVRPDQGIEIGEFKDQLSIAEKPRGAMVAAALRVFIDAVAKLERPVDRIDKNLLDGLVASIDAKLSEQLDEVLHHREFQRLESGWRGLKFLVDRTDFRRNVRIEVLNASKDALRSSFEDSPELIQSALYKQVYTGA